MSDRLAAQVPGLLAAVKAGVRLQQPAALDLAVAAGAWVSLREAVHQADLMHGTACARWRNDPACSCGLDALRRATR